MNQLRWQPWTDPRAWQPYPTVFQLADAAGVHTCPGVLADLREHPADQGRAQRRHLPRPALRRGPHGPRGRAAGRRRTARSVYTYYSELDGKGHRFGVDSDAWRGQLMYVDRLVQRLAEQLPPRSALYVTADHGMIDIPFDEQSRIDFDEDWELRAGVALLGGEGRARHVYAVPGAAGRRARPCWREVLGEQFWVATRDEANCSPSTSRQHGQHVGLGARDRVHMAGPALAAQQGDSGAQLPVLVEVDARLLVEGDVDHAVVGGDVQRGAGRELLGEALDEPVDVHQLAAPGVGVDAEAVALAVDFAVVRVDERAVAGGQLLGREVHPLLAGEPAVEGAAAQRDLRQRGVLEGRRGDLGGVHARRVGQLEDGGVRLPGAAARSTAASAAGSSARRWPGCARCSRAGRARRAAGRCRRRRARSRWWRGSPR